MPKLLLSSIHQSLKEIALLWNLSGRQHYQSSTTILSVMMVNMVLSWNISGKTDETQKKYKQILKGVFRMQGNVALAWYATH
jgi:hypothetical protein